VRLLVEGRIVPKSMTLPAIGSWIVAAGYGLWAGLCVVATSAGVATLTSRDSHSVAGFVSESLEYAALAAAMATLGWILMHHRGRQPGPGSYIALAISIVVTVHFWLVYRMTAGSAAATPFLGAAFLGFLFHYWFTLPIAVGATGLFVWCLKRGWAG
jgi:hypothetical protein